MKNDQLLTIDGLLDWKNSKEIEYAGSYGKGSNKSLCVTLYGSYKVYCNKVLVLECGHPFPAVDKYNSLP